MCLSYHIFIPNASDAVARQKGAIISVIEVLESTEVNETPIISS